MSRRIGQKKNGHSKLQKQYVQMQRGQTQAGPAYRLVSAVGVHVGVAKRDGAGMEGWVKICRT